MSVLNEIQTGKQQLPPRVTVYGTPGIGKTLFASKAPKPIFIQTEDGLSEIDCDRFPLATLLETVLQFLTALLNETHKYQTVVIDSLDWLEQLIFQELCRQYSVSSIEKVDGGYSRGYTHALIHWKQILDLLNALRLQKSMIVILIAHAKVERFEDPESTAYDRYSPRLHKHASALVCEWSDAVLFATRKIRVQSEDAGFNRKRGIAYGLGRDGGERVLRTIGSPSCVAKNRYSLPEEIPLDWDAFLQSMTQPQLEPQP